MQLLQNDSGGPTRRMPLVIACCFLLLAGLGETHAQTLRAQIKITSVAPARVQIDVQLPAATDVLSFRNTHAGALGLGDRIERMEVCSGTTEVKIKKLAPGEYQGEAKFTELSYEVNITEPAQPAQMSRVSWLNSTQGLLMLADLLPRGIRGTGSVASIDLEVPSGWSAASNISGKDHNYLTAEPEHGVFLVGASVREKSVRIGAGTLSFITSDKWPISDDEALKIGEKLIREYSNMTGYSPKSNSSVMLIPYPGQEGPERWSAETRGNVVVLLLGRQASRKRVKAKLGIVLSHEIFHLWVPNALGLQGNYDWFFEGFTVYQALRMDLRLELISFETYLETIARVYDSYLLSPDADRWSLIEASELRWTTVSSLVYEKGMLIALLYDLALRSATNCQESLDDVYRQLFRQQQIRQGSANETIIKVLSERTGMETFSRDYVEKTGRIDLEQALAPFGIQLKRSTGKATQLRPASDLNQTQRKGLRCLGYRG